MNSGESGLEAMFTMESGGRVVEQRPFRILVLGDWSGDGDKKPLSVRKPVEIDRDNFDEVLGRIAPRVAIGTGENRLELAFRSLDDFHPDPIFQSVPLFGELRGLRRSLKDESTFHSAAREVRERFGMDAREEAPPPPAEAADPPAGLLDAILTAPSGGAAPKKALSSDLENLVADLVRPHLVTIEEDERSQLTRALDAATSGLMRKIVHDRRFQELEAAWRGLYFLVRRTATATDLKIFILDVSKEELAEDLKEAASLSDTVLYRHLIRDAVETPGGEPWAVLLGNFAFQPAINDVAELIRISKLSEAANAPFISHMRPDVLGVHSLAEHPEPRDWHISADADAAKLWAALRDQTESVYLGMVMPRFLLRLPYGSETEPTEQFAFEETDGPPEHDKYLWGNPCFAAGVLLAESFHRHGWEMGEGLSQDIEGLPVHTFKEGTETMVKPCAEVLLSENASTRMLEYGLMPLVSYKNGDRVKLAGFRSIAGSRLKAMWT